MKNSIKFFILSILLISCTGVGAQKLKMLSTAKIAQTVLKINSLGVKRINKASKEISRHNTQKSLHFLELRTSRRSTKLQSKIIALQENVDISPKVKLDREQKQMFEYCKIIQDHNKSLERIRSKAALTGYEFMTEVEEVPEIVLIQEKIAQKMESWTKSRKNSFKKSRT